MKKLLIILSVILISCQPNNNVPVFNTYTVIRGRELEVYVIDSCEYIGFVHGGAADILTHKGNCKNPIHYDNRPK